MNPIDWLGTNHADGFTTAEVILNFSIAALCGVLLGIERELNRKPNGLRTNMLICVGAALFTHASLMLGGENDRARIAAQIVSGIGFLGAGAIMRQGEDHITGLTSAAMVWFVAAVGIIAGAGYIWLALVGSCSVLVLMQVLFLFEWWILSGFQIYALEVITAGSREVQSALIRSLLISLNVRQLALEAVHAEPGEIRFQVIYWARRRRHQRVRQRIQKIPGVREIHELYAVRANPV